VAIPIQFLFDPVDRASAIVPLLCGASVFSVVYMTLGWRFGYLPTINRVTAWRARRAKTPPSEDEVAAG
jgi:hypothetical protein